MRLKCVPFRLKCVFDFPSAHRRADTRAHTQWKRRLTAPIRWEVSTALVVPSADGLCTHNLSHKRRTLTAWPPVVMSDVCCASGPTWHSEEGEVYYIRRDKKKGIILTPNYINANENGRRLRRIDASGDTNSCDDISHRTYFPTFVRSINGKKFMLERGAA